MLRQMIRLECRKAFKNKLFYAAIAIGCIITMFSLVYNAGIYQNELLMIRSYDINPMYEATNLFNFWVGGEPFSFGSAAYFFSFPLLAALPYGWSYCEEKQSGYIRMAAVHAGKRAYFLAKYAAVFLSGAFVMVIPLMFNFFLSSMFFRLLCRVLYTARVMVFFTIRLCRCFTIPRRFCMC